ncbi:HNH endonuclease domain-containing protein [uncultured Streptococcus sp.]|uniref:HNH endonuclease domain-containing protein n=1 Tax=uncultured Streptococcus sp. TaxID=83427 RepID=UPI0028D544C4|nr:HNH endonuclease domain-containing protein [uncultured Streptococcus sp.]
MIKLELPQQPQLKEIDVCFENYYKSLLEKLSKDGNTHRIIPEILKLCGNMANFKLLITDEWLNIKNKPDSLLFEYYLVGRFYLELKKMKASDDKKYRIEWVSNILQCITHYPKMEELIDCNHLYYGTSNFSNFLRKNKNVFNNFDELNNKLKNFLDYEYFREHYRVTLWELYGCEVCPYCNLMPITNHQNFTTADIEHFYPKSIFSLFCVSKFNLVPSCKDCNRQFKGAKYFHYNPRYEGLDEYFKFNFSVNTSFEQTIDNYLSHSSEIAEDGINLAIKSYTKDKYVKETLSILEISSRYNSTPNRTDICKFIKDTERIRSLVLKPIVEVKNKEDILNLLSPFIDRGIYQSRKFMNIEKGKFKADISSMFQDYIEGLLYP